MRRTASDAGCSHRSRSGDSGPHTPRRAGSGRAFRPRPAAAAPTGSLSAARSGFQSKTVGLPDHLHIGLARNYFIQCSSTRLYLHFVLDPEATCVPAAVSAGPRPRASGSHADPQAADQGPVEPDLHVQLPAGLRHQHARGQTSQDQQRWQRLLET